MPTGLAGLSSLWPIRRIAALLAKILFGIVILLAISALCRPTFAGVSISPEVVILSGDQTVKVTARLNTRLPVVVSLVELSNPVGGDRKPNQAGIWSGQTVARLSRQRDGTFAATINLDQHQPATRYFQVAARYAFSPIPRLNGADIRTLVTDIPIALHVAAPQTSTTPTSTDLSSLPVPRPGVDKDGYPIWPNAFLPESHLAKEGFYLPTSTKSSYYEGQHITLPISDSVYTLKRFTSQALGVTFLHLSKEGITHARETIAAYPVSGMSKDQDEIVVGINDSPPMMTLTFQYSDIQDPARYVMFLSDNAWKPSGEKVNFKGNKAYYEDDIIYVRRSRGYYSMTFNEGEAGYIDMNVILGSLDFCSLKS